VNVKQNYLRVNVLPSKNTKHSFFLYLKYLLSPSITKSTKRLLSIDEKIDGKDTKIFFLV